MPELKDLSVDWISLVSAPANGKPLVLKGAGGKPALLDVRKMDDDRMRAYGIVYAPEQKDSQGDWATAETIRQASDSFMREGLSKQVDKEHSFRESGNFVAESWIVRARDPLFGKSEDVGAWAVGIQVTSPGEWRRLKAGELAGLSLAGQAMSAPDEPEGTAKGDEAPGWLTRLIKQLLPKEEDEMDEKQVKEIAKDTATAAVKAVLDEYGIQKGHSKSGGDKDGKQKGHSKSGGDKDGKQKGQDKTEGDMVTRSDLDTFKSEITKGVTDAIADALQKGASEGDLGEADPGEHGYL